MSRVRFWLIFGGLMVSVFVSSFDATLMASSHPVITSYFNASNAASWLSTAFLLTSTALQPMFGRLSDTFGRRDLYVASLFIFALSTVMCALAPSMGSLIVARALGGFGAGGAGAMGSIVVSDLVRIEDRGTYQSIINLFYGVGSACGAAFGGYLCDAVGWRWTFGMQVPLMLVALALGAFCIPGRLGPCLGEYADDLMSLLREFDFLGSGYLSATVAFLILGLDLGGNVLAWTHPAVIISLVLCIPLGFMTIRTEARHPRPVMPLDILFSRPRGNMVFANFLASIGLNTILFNAPLYFQAVKFDTPSQSGFRLTFPAIAMCTLAIWTGIYITRTGRIRGLLFGGIAAMILGGLGTTLAWDGIPSWLMTIFLVPSAVGQGLNFPASSIGLLAVSTQEEQAVITTTSGLWRNLGAIAGVSLSSVIMQNVLRRNLQTMITGDDKEQVSRVTSDLTFCGLSGF